MPRNEFLGRWGRAGSERVAAPGSAGAWGAGTSASAQVPCSSGSRDAWWELADLSCRVGG